LERRRRLELIVSAGQKAADGGHHTVGGGLPGRRQHRSPLDLTISLLY